MPDLDVDAVIDLVRDMQPANHDEVMGELIFYAGEAEAGRAMRQAIMQSRVHLVPHQKANGASWLEVRDGPSPRCPIVSPQGRPCGIREARHGGHHVSYTTSGMVTWPSMATGKAAA